MVMSCFDVIQRQCRARLYSRLEPRLDDAYAELGSGGPFADALRRALVHLVTTPDVDGTPRLQTARGTNYAYADQRLERLSAAQRQHPASCRSFRACASTRSTTAVPAWRAPGG